jgi:hypothetical protein
MEIQATENVIKSLKLLVIAGKKISADKKVDLNDLPAAMELLVQLPFIYDSLSKLSLVKEEMKSLSKEEIIALIEAVDSAVKIIEQA